MPDFMPDSMPIITSLIVIATISIVLVMLWSGTEQDHRSMEDVDTRRERKLGSGDESAHTS